MKINSRNSFIQLLESGNDKINLIKVFKVIQSKGPLSRRMIHQLTGIYNCSIPRLVSKLIKIKVVEECEKAQCKITGHKVGMLSIDSTLRNTKHDK